VQRPCSEAVIVGVRQTIRTRANSGTRDAKAGVRWPRWTRRNLKATRRRLAVPRVEWLSQKPGI
jgi:hypothetical protein